MRYHLRQNVCFLAGGPSKQIVILVFKKLVWPKSGRKFRKGHDNISVTKAEGQNRLHLNSAVLQSRFHNKQPNHFFFADFSFRETAHPLSLTLNQLRCRDRRCARLCPSTSGRPAARSEMLAGNCVRTTSGRDATTFAQKTFYRKRIKLTNWNRNWWLCEPQRLWQMLAKKRFIDKES